MKIALIEPSSPDYHVFSSFPIPRLGLPILGTILEQQGHQVQIYCEDIYRIDWREIAAADLVGISSTTSTAPQGYRIAQRAAKNGTPVVFGGAHASFRPTEALRYGQFVLRGEAEESFPQLIDRLHEPSAWSEIAGLSYNDRDDEIHHNPDAPLIADVNTLPIPDLNLIVGIENVVITPIQTSRGCPFNCKFCSVTQMFGRRYRFRDEDLVIEELHRNMMGRKFAFVYDDHFTANRERTKRLLERMIHEGFDFRWDAQVRVEAANDRELLELMRRAGCYRVYVGLESVNPDTLEAYNKGQTLQDMVRCIHRFREYGIKVHGMFVVGSDEDTEQTPQEIINFSLKHDIDTVQMMALTPLPGTPLYDELSEQDRIFTHHWELYDGMHVVHEPKKVTPYQLQKAVIRHYKRFYSRWGIVKMLFKFQWINAYMLSVGHKIIRQWSKTNRWYLPQLRSIPHLKNLKSLAHELLRSKVARDSESAKYRYLFNSHRKSARMRISFVEASAHNHAQASSVPYVEPRDKGKG